MALSLPLGFLTLAVAATAAADEPGRIKVVPSRLLPAGVVVVLVKAGAPGPGVKGYEPALKIVEFGAAVSVPGTGPYDLYLVPKQGLPVRVVEKWKPQGAETEVKPADLVGTLYVRGDDLPRAGNVVVTDPADPGPDEKGHTPIQEAADYKAYMLVRPGLYAVWVKPANGGAAQKIEGKVRVSAGRVTQVPE